MPSPISPTANPRVTATPTDPHRLSGDAVLEALGVDPAQGLNEAEVETRRASVGANVLTDVARIPGWRRFVGQFRDAMILILIGAALTAFVVSGELKTPLVVLLVVLINAVIGFVQENRAERSLEALRDMLVDHARVRRNATASIVPLSSTGSRRHRVARGR